LGHFDQEVLARISVRCRKLGASVFWKIALVLAVIVGGPLLGILTTMAGCFGPTPIFGVMCGHNTVYPLVLVTFIGWALLGVLAIVMTSDRGRRSGKEEK
jgi:hypothetical protein